MSQENTPIDTSPRPGGFFTDSFKTLLKGRWFWTVTAILLVAGAAVVAYAIYKDWPNRLLERRLSQELGLQVDIDGWALEDENRYVVDNMVLRSEDPEGLAFKMRISKVHVTADLADLLAGSLQHLRLMDATLTTVLPAEELPGPKPLDPLPQASARVDDLEIPQLEIQACPPGVSVERCEKEPGLRMAGKMTASHIGRADPHVQLDIEARDLNVSSFLASFGLPITRADIQDFDLDIRLRPQEEARRCLSIITAAEPSMGNSPAVARTTRRMLEVFIDTKIPRIAASLPVADAELRTETTELQSRLTLTLDPGLLPIADIPRPFSTDPGPFLCHAEIETAQTRFRIHEAAAGSSVKDPSAKDLSAEDLVMQGLRLVPVDPEPEAKPTATRGAHSKDEEHPSFRWSLHSNLWQTGSLTWGSGLHGSGPGWTLALEEIPIAPWIRTPWLPSSWPVIEDPLDRLDGSVALEVGGRVGGQAGGQIADASKTTPSSLLSGRAQIHLEPLALGDDLKILKSNLGASFRLKTEGLEVSDGDLSLQVAVEDRPPIDVDTRWSVDLPFPFNPSSLDREHLPRFSLESALNTSFDGNGEASTLAKLKLHNQDSTKLWAGSLESRLEPSNLLRWWISNSGDGGGALSGLQIQGATTFQGRLAAEGLFDSPSGFEPPTPSFLDASTKPTPSDVYLVLDGDAAITGLALSDDEGSRALEGLGVKARTQTGFGWSDGAVDHLWLDLDGQAGGFLMLWQTVFADLSEMSTPFKIQVLHPAPATTLPGSLGSNPPEPWALNVDLRPDIAPHVNVEGLIALGGAVGEDLSSQAHAGELKGTLKTDDLSSFFDQILAPVFELSTASLAGSADTEFDLKWSRQDKGLQADLRGKVLLGDVHMEQPGLKIRSLNLDLPIHLERRPQDSGHARLSPAEMWIGDETRGNLEWAGAEAAGIELSPIRTRLVLQGDSLRLEEPLSISLLDGHVELSDVRAVDLLSPEPFAEMGVHMQEISLAALTASQGLPTVNGRLNGSLDEVRVSAQHLETRGEGIFNLLGGTVRVRDISGREIFTPFPRIQGSADLEHIDLAQLTGRFDVGQVTGILYGTVERCELFRGIPTSFEATFQTRKEKGVAQTVDVKAVKNLTILGTGQGGNFFDHGLQKFLSHYRYSAFGVKVDLEDDVLLLQGLEKRGHKELFLKGGFPFGIDVVNARPGQTVSFLTMVERLKALDFGQADIR